MAGTQSSNHRKMQRVPRLLLEDEKNKDDYRPKVVSIGPYHHGNTELASVEAFKPTAVNLFVSNSTGKSKEFYYNSILEIIDDIQNYYDRDSSIDPKHLESAYLAEMMLRDAAFIIIYLEIYTRAKLDSSFRNKIDAFGQLGKLTLAIVPRDLLLLENQIPLFVIKLLIKLRCGDSEDNELVDRYVNMYIYNEYRQQRTNSPPEPLHLLEVFHRLVSVNCDSKATTVCFKCRWFCCRFTPRRPPTTGGGAALTCCSCALLCCSGYKKEMDPETSDVRSKNGKQGWILRLMKLVTSCKSKNRYHTYSFRSVTDLKAKGIHFRPSPTQSLKDVKFKSHFFYARVELPKWFVSIYTKSFFLNLVAFEVCPNNHRKEAAVAAYINLMKSLVDSPADVKELRERNIIFNTLGSDEEVLNIFNDIKTYGAGNEMLYSHVKDDIQAHYNSRIKTWIAELIHTNFRSPWTITAFLAAVGLLAISVGQLYYAVYPNS